MTKPKLNQPDVEITTTTIGESITIHQTIPSKQFKDIFVTGTTVGKIYPTLEQVKQEWEELGYEWCASNNNKHIVLIKNIKNDKYNGDYTKIISINSITKTYSCYIDENYSFDEITFTEHQLLTKTFKALGWEI